jgi:putative heme-binding domain-containing protein
VKTVWSNLLPRPETLRQLYELRAEVRNAAVLAPDLTAALQTLVARDPSPANRDLLVQLATGFRLVGLESEVIAAASQTGASPDVQLAALRALRESGSTRVDILLQFARSGDPAVRREAVTALAQSRRDEAVPALIQTWPNLTPALRKVALEGLTGSPARARQLLAAVQEGTIARDELDGYTLEKLATVLPEDPFLLQLRQELSTTLRPVLRLNGGDDDAVESSFTLEGPFTLESWVRLDPGIGNQDSLLGSPGQFDANFFGSVFRVWLGGGRHDVVVASKAIAPESWTHVAVTRDSEGIYRIYWNGELDATSAPGESRPLTGLTLGRSTASGGTAGEFAEYRLWKVCRSPDQIRAFANLELPASTPGLIYSGQGDSWGTLLGQARLERTTDLPPVLSQAESEALEAKFSSFRALASQAGEVAEGQKVFAVTCGVCHTVRGNGGRIGPALDGAGAHGTEALLRNLLTPSAAMEAGYRRYRVETQEGDVWEGLLAGEDAETITLRQPNTEDQRFERSRLKRFGFAKGSVMPEGLLEALPPDQARDLLAYLLTLK